MIWALRVFFLFVFFSMVAVTTYASLECAVWELPAGLLADRWFHATLADAYFGFLTFFVWVAYKEGSIPRSATWLVLILLFGNMAMAAYALIQLFRVPANAPLSAVLLRA